MQQIKESKSKAVVQKYIENPLIIERKKFDIRQWVLVTDWNPLTVWAYEDCYIRLAAIDYDPNTNNRYSHLTNNAVVEQFVKKEYGDEDDEEEEVEMDNIMSKEDFEGFLQGQYKGKADDVF